MQRAYAPVIDRQQAVDRLVSSESELRRVLGEIVRGNSQVATIRLAGDIRLTSSIALSDFTDGYNVVIDGGGRYVIGPARNTSLTELFLLTTGTNFGQVVGPSFRGVRFEGDATCTTLFRITSVTTGVGIRSGLYRVNLEDCQCTTLATFIVAGSGTPALIRCRLTNVYAAPPAGIFDIGTVVSTMSVYDRVFSQLNAAAPIQLATITHTGSYNGFVHVNPTAGVGATEFLLP